MQAIMPRCAKYRHVVFPGASGRLKNLSQEGLGRNVEVRVARPIALPAENAAFFRWLFGQVGLDAHAYRAETLQRRISACLRLLRVPTVRAARRVLDEMPEQIPLVISALVLGVTAFFRDRPVFDLLRETVLPSLASGRGLRVWSAGCSDGPELYSVTMLLGDMGLLTGSCLLGTDCRADAIQRARAGCYDGMLMKSVPAHYRERYFREDGTRGWVRPEMVAAVCWRSGSVLEVQDRGIWDMILCRNLAMYLQPEITTTLWERLEVALRPGGVLVLGKAERPNGSRRLSLVGPCVYRRTRG